jgi:hypothetical protein
LIKEQTVAAAAGTSNRNEAAATYPAQQTCGRIGRAAQRGQSFIRDHCDVTAGRDARFLRKGIGCGNREDESGKDNPFLGGVASLVKTRLSGKAKASAQRRGKAAEDLTPRSQVPGLFSIWFFAVCTDILVLLLLKVKWRDLRARN